MSDLMSDLDAMFSDNTTPVVEEVKEPVQQVVETPQTVVQTPTQTVQKSVPVVPVVQQAQNQVVAAPSADDFEIDLPDSLKSQIAEMGMEVGDIGIKVSSVPIEKYKASASKIDRIGFITKKVIPVKLHYFEGVGSILCNHGKCCELAGNPQIKYLFPVVVYTTDAEGNLSGGNVSLKMLAAGKDLYQTIITVNNGSKAMGGIDHVDLLVTCTDERYQKMTLVQAGKAVWREYPQIREFLQNKWVQDGADAYMAVARKVDEESLMKLLNMSDDSNDSTPSYDMAQNTDLSKYFN